MDMQIEIGVEHEVDRCYAWARCGEYEARGARFVRADPEAEREAKEKHIVIVNRSGERVYVWPCDGSVPLLMLSEPTQDEVVLALRQAMAAGA